VEILAPTGIQPMETVQPVTSRYTDRAAPVQNLIKKQRPLIGNVVSPFICLHRPKVGTDNLNRIIVYGNNQRKDVTLGTAK